MSQRHMLAVHGTGLVIMHFAVRRNGQIDGLEISKSSGDDGLDKAHGPPRGVAMPRPFLPEVSDWTAEGAGSQYNHIPGGNLFASASVSP